MIRRFSSRAQPLGKSFLVERLRGARSYDRIAGYFIGSVLEVAGEEIQNVAGVVRVVCNSHVRGADVATARAAAQAQRVEWCASRPEQLGEIARERFAGLYELLRSGKLVVRVLPNARFGTVKRWQEDPDPAPVAVEAPVTRREAELWKHQKYFVSLALKAHRRRGHARFVLADQVGLGKTVQLAMATQLMVLVGNRPALVLAPRTLLRQWQTELRERTARGACATSIASPPRRSGSARGASCVSSTAS